MISSKWTTSLQKYKQCILETALSELVHDDNEYSGDQYSVLAETCYNECRCDNATASSYDDGDDESRDSNPWSSKIVRFFPGHSALLPPIYKFWKFGLPKWHFLHFKSSLEHSLKVSFIKYLLVLALVMKVVTTVSWELVKATGQGQSIAIAPSWRTHFGRKLEHLHLICWLIYCIYLKSILFLNIFLWLSNCTKI